jgi:hypothetical protein
MQAFAVAMYALNYTADQLLAQKELLQVVLGYHVSATVYPTVASMAAAKTIPTLINATLSVVTSTAGATTIVGYSSNATILNDGFAGLIQPNGTSVSACRHCGVLVCRPHHGLLHTAPIHLPPAALNPRFAPSCSPAAVPHRCVLHNRPGEAEMVPLF